LHHRLGGQNHPCFEVDSGVAKERKSKKEKKEKSEKKKKKKKERRKKEKEGRKEKKGKKERARRILSRPTNKNCTVGPPLTGRPWARLHPSESAGVGHCLTHPRRLSEHAEDQQGKLKKKKRKKLKIVEVPFVVERVR